LKTRNEVKKTGIDGQNFLIALVCGLLIGITIPGLAVLIGMSSKLVGPVTGAIAGALVPLIYQIRMRKPPAGREAK
jgi:hypothetical protein